MQDSPMSKPVLLCIDDELNGLEVRKMVLESAGYSVLTAGDGTTGLEIFASQHVDLVVLDYAMPEMNGYDVAVEMKRISPGIPILMLSAYFPLPADALRVVDTYVTKGDSPVQLFEQVRALIFPPKKSAEPSRLVHGISRDALTNSVSNLR